MRIVTLVMVTSAVAAVGSGPLLAAPFSDIVVFGNSLSDTGNIHTLTSRFAPLTGKVVPDEPYVGGRFSNGAVWVDHLGVALGLDASTPMINGGSNYAFGGAHTSRDNDSMEEVLGPFSALGKWGIQTQVLSHVGEHTTEPADRLHVLWGGGNDFLDGRTDPWQAAVNMVTNIAILHEYAGAKQFLIPNLPPLGLIPRYQQTSDTADDQAMNALSGTFNLYLNGFLDMLEGYWTDMDVYRVDVFDLYLDLFADPGQYGLTNVTEPAYDEGAGTIVPNPDEYLFWDDIHPTARGHELLAIAAVSSLPSDALVGLGGATVPEPAALSLLVVGTLALTRRRHGGVVSS